MVTMYLLTSVNLRLRPKILAELAGNPPRFPTASRWATGSSDKTSAVSTSFGDERDVHFWIVPANATGRWSGRRRRLAQQALRARGQPAVPGRDRLRTRWGLALAVADIRLTGDAISFRVDTETDGKMISHIYEGKIKGDQDRRARSGPRPIRRPWLWPGKRHGTPRRSPSLSSPRATGINRGRRPVTTGRMSATNPGSRSARRSRPAGISVLERPPQLAGDRENAPGSRVWPCDEGAGGNTPAACRRTCGTSARGRSRWRRRGQTGRRRFPGGPSRGPRRDRIRVGGPTSTRGPRPA